MRRGLTVAVAVLSSAALIGIGAGCGGSDSGAASTPGDAKTIANKAVQTDSNGKTVAAPAAAAAAGAADAAPAAGASGGGDVAAGKTIFEATCQGCHMGAGTQAGGVGPKLAGMGLTLDAIKHQIINGGGPMPAGLLSGTDLDNAAAYVESIQK